MPRWSVGFQEGLLKALGHSGPLGLQSFPIHPCLRPPESDTYYDLFNAKYTTQYLEDCVDRRNFAGLRLRARIRFDSHVHEVVKLDGKWAVSVKDKTDDTYTIRSTKLTVASGLTSRQYVPCLSGSEKSDRPIIHQENFG